jgi:hypothetical protein
MVWLDFLNRATAEICDALPFYEDNRIDPCAVDWS